MSSETGPISLSSSESQAEDWDRSLREPYPGDSSKETESSAPGPRGDVRTRKLSELLKLHAEKGTDVEMSAEEASAVAEVLGRWNHRPLKEKTISSHLRIHKMILRSRPGVPPVDPPSRVGLAVKAKASKATNHDVL